MNTRPYLDKSHPDIYRALGHAAATGRKAYHTAGLTRELIELINVRVSQINGCPTCLSIHVPAARKAGIPEQVLDLLPSWYNDTSSVFTDEQKAALSLAEALTLPQATSQNNPIAEAIHQASELFTSEQLSALQWAIIFINTYNRISIASGHPPLPAQ